MHKLFQRVRRDQRGFTLIELLVVVAIIGLLAAFAVPRLWEAINKAKGSQGTADLETIAGALDRHYMDNNSYPHGDDAPDADDAVEVMNALEGSYLKKGTTFRNGFDRGYLFLTSVNGKGFVLIDVANDTQDDVSGTTGLQINVVCTDDDTATPDQTRTFTIVEGKEDASGNPLRLVIPTVASGDWRVPDTFIHDCALQNENDNIKVYTH